jgi:hypothetical protein
MLKAARFGSKTEAYIRGYDRGYRAAYKRHYEYWRLRLAHWQAKRCA